MKSKENKMELNQKMNSNISKETEFRLEWNHPGLRRLSLKDAENGFDTPSSDGLYSFS